MNEDASLPEDSPDTAWVEMALEERLGGAEPPDLADRIRRATARRARAGSRLRALPPARRRSRLVAAALLLAGVGAVLGVAALGGQRRDAVPAQDPKADAKTPTKDAAAFFPLTLGTRWDYQDRVDGRTSEHTVRVAAAATAGTAAGDARVVQLAESGDGALAFSFWSVDARGVHRHASQAMAGDPTFQPVGTVVRELASPIGGEASWKIERLPGAARPGGVVVGVGGGPGGGGALGGGAGGPAGGVMVGPGGGGRRREQATDALPGTATLLGVDEELTLGERSFRCLHVRVTVESPDGALDEHSWYARGVGLVRRTTRVGDQPERVRELVRFVPAPPLPARDQVLAAGLAAPAPAVEWLNLPAEEETVWTQRSAYALVRTEGGAKVYRVFDARAVAFDPRNLESWEALAQDEDFAPRMNGMFPQRVAEGIGRLALRLHAAQQGLQLEKAMTRSVEVGPGRVRGMLAGRLRSEDGKEQPCEVTVVLEGGVPTQVSVGSPPR